MQSELSGSAERSGSAGADGDVSLLADFLVAGKILVLTGAGISTESGIPDYRGAGPREPRPKPMTYQQFMGSLAARRRYWARSLVGWRQMSSVEPNAGHLAVAELGRRGLLAGLITQNVDGLHTRAGSPQVIELHGDLGLVACQQCGRREARADFQQRLEEANGGVVPRLIAELPDGDAEVGDIPAEFTVPSCAACGGVLKPDVVFFGENVPKQRVELGGELLAAADRLLVLGSSLEVFSGFRFVLAAAEQAKPIAIVNSGPTRGDGMATLRIDARIGDVLPKALALLT